MASLEDTQLITQGAQLLAAGQTLGLTPDEAMAARKATLRREQRQRRAQRGEREGNRAAAEAFLAEDAAKFNAKGGLTPFERQLALGGNVQADIDDVGFAFGEDPQIIVDSKGRRIENDPRRPQDDDQVYSREEKIRNDVLGEDFLQPEEIAMQREGRGRKQVGLGGMRDALNRLQMAKDQYGFQAFGQEGKEMERLYYALKDDVGDGQQNQRNRQEAQKAVVADARRRRGDVSDAAIASAADRVVREAADKRLVRAQGPEERQVIPAGKGEPAKENFVPPFVLESGNQGVNSEDLRKRVDDEMLARRADGMAFGPQRRGLKIDAAVEREANELAAGPMGAARRIGLKNLAAEKAVKQLGAAGPAAHGNLHEDNLEYGGVNDAANFGQADPLVDSKNRVLGYFGDVNGNMVQLGEVNSVDSANTLNAPKATPMMQWVAENQPAFGKNGVFGVPEADFNEAMALIGDRARGLQGLGLEGMGNPKNLQEVEKVMGAIVGRGQKAGKQFFRFDADLGKNIPVAQPGVPEVMNMLRIPPAQQEMVAFALMQDALANAQDVNQADKQAFRARVARPPGDNVNMNAPELRVDGGLPIDMIKNEKVGRGKKAKGVRAALAAIDQNPVLEALNERGELFGTTPDGKQVLLPEAARIIEGANQARNDAQMPMQAAIKGEGAKRARFVRGSARGMSPSEMEAKFGPENARIAREVMDRYDRAEAARQASPIDPGAVLQRRRDQQMREEGFAAAYKAEEAEKAELVRLMEQGAAVNAPPMLGEKIGGRERVVPAAPAGRRLVVPNDSAFGGPMPIMVKAEGQGNPRVRISESPDWQKQRIQQASTPASIATTVGDSTGNQPAPMIDAGGGMQQPPRSAGPAAPAPAPGGGGPMPDSMRNELFNLPGPYRKKMMSEPDGPGTQREAAINRIKRGAGNQMSEWKDNAKAFATEDKYKVGRRALYSGGTLAGLATVLGLSNIGKEERQEEQV